MSERYETTEHPSAEVLRLTQQTVSNLDQAALRTLEYATAVLYPDSNPRRFVNYAQSDQPPLRLWRSTVENKWSTQFTKLISHAYKEFRNLEPADITPDSPTILPLEVNYFAQTLDSTGTISATIQQSLSSDNQFSAEAATRLVAELKLAQIYQQHRRLRLYGHAFCVNPVLSNPRHLNSILDELEDVIHEVAEAEDRAGSVIDSRLDEDFARWSVEDENRVGSVIDPDLEWAILQVDDDVLKKSNSLVRASIMHNLGASFDLPKQEVIAAVQSRFLQLHIQDIAKMLGIPEHELADIILTPQPTALQAGKEVQRANVVGRIYVSSIKHELLHYVNAQEAETRLGKIGNRVVSAMQLWRAKVS